jgi:cytochrome c-type biogenesis protein CcmH/NrfG
MEAAIALRAADLPAAAKLLQQHLARSPTDAGSWLTLSEVQTRLGDFPAAEESREKAAASESQ